MNQIEIREAKIEDAPALALVHVKTWQSAYKGQVPETYLQNLSVDERTQKWHDQLSNLSTGTHVFVATLDGHIVGFCVVGNNRDEDMDDKTGELHSIYVLPEYSGIGVGSSLMNLAKETLKKQGFLRATLWVLDTNEKSRKWYESKGWRPEGLTKVVDHRGGFRMNEVRYITVLS